jgi:hypothetical protein
VITQENNKSKKQQEQEESGGLLLRGAITWSVTASAFNESILP